MASSLLKPQSHLQKRPTADSFELRKNKIIRATVDSSSDVVLADIDICFRRPTNLFMLL